MSPTRNISSAAITSSPLSSEPSHISMANRACSAWKDASNSDGGGGAANEGGSRRRSYRSLGDEHAKDRSFYHICPRTCVRRPRSEIGRASSRKRGCKYV